MRWLFVLLLTGCSTLESRRENQPLFQQITTASVQSFQGCFAEKTAKQNVQYLPKGNGGTFSSGAGPQHYVFWVVDIDDLGAQRRVTVYAVNSATGRNLAIPAVQACL